MYLLWFNFIGIQIAVDVSLPLHCEEPYAIENFVQEDWTEGSSRCTVEPEAWFGGLVTSVELICDDVTIGANFNYAGLHVNGNLNLKMKTVHHPEHTPRGLKQELLSQETLHCINKLRSMYK